MNIIERGQAFAQSLRAMVERTAWDWKRCPQCGSTLTIKNGSYQRQPWFLDGRQTGARAAPAFDHARAVAAHDHNIINDAARPALLEPDPLLRLPIRGHEARDPRAGIPDRRPQLAAQRLLLRSRSRRDWKGQSWKVPITIQHRSRIIGSKRPDRLICVSDLLFLLCLDLRVMAQLQPANVYTPGSRVARAQSPASPALAPARTSPACADPAGVARVLQAELLPA